MGTERSCGVRSTSRDRRLRCETLGIPHFSASLAGPMIRCYGSTPCPRVRFPEGPHLSNNELEKNYVTHIIVPGLQRNRARIEFAFVLETRRELLLRPRRVEHVHGQSFSYRPHP